VDVMLHVTPSRQGHLNLLQPSLQIVDRPVFRVYRDELGMVGYCTVATNGLLLETFGVADGGVGKEGHDGCSDDDSDKGVQEDFLVEDAVKGRSPSHRPCYRCVARQDLIRLPLGFKRRPPGR
jgi:hypothetical protein